MSDIENIRALIERARCDSGAAAELDEVWLQLLAWQTERSRGEADAGTPAETGLACVVRFDQSEARMLDLLAAEAGVPSRVVAQRLAGHAVWNRETRHAAVQSQPRS